MRNISTAKVNRTRSTSRRTKKTQEVNLNNIPVLNSLETQQENTMNTENIKLETSGVSSITPLPGNRPIDSSNIQVTGTISVMGERPIVASNMKIWNTITVSGERPIYASNLQISETQIIMGNRPVASNYFENEENLMGYLD